MNRVDVHAHLGDPKFAGETDEIVKRFTLAGVKTVVTSGYDVQSSVSAKDIAEKYENVYFSAGVHPDEARTFDKSAEETLYSLGKHEKCVAIGEIGLDFYWNKSTEEEQRSAFIRQIEIANELGKPFVVHSREANAKTLALLKEHKDLIKRGFLMHCYAGSKEDVKNYAALGAYFSFGGVITFKNAKKEEIVKSVPADRILTETDCPYLTPEPHRGTRNEPAYIEYILEKISYIREEDKEITAKRIAENAIALLGV